MSKRDSLRDINCLINFLWMLYTVFINDSQETDVD